MSGILRSSLRLVNTAKYAKYNSTKYFRTMAPPNNNFNASLALHPPDDLSISVRLLNTQAKKNSMSLWEWMMIPADMLLAPKSPVKRETSSILGNLIVSQSSGTMDIFVNNKRCSNIFLPTVFTTELNKKLIEPTSDTNASEEIKGPRYFRGNGLITILLDGDKLQFKFDNSDETYIVSQEVHVKAFNDPAAQIQKNGGLKILTRLDLDDLRAYDAKLTFKTPTGGDSRTYQVGCHAAPPKQWDRFGDYGLEEITKKNAELNPAAVAEYPGRVKLQFPMDLSLQGFKHIIKVKETGETFEVCHTVNIKVLKKSGDKINKESKNLKFDAIIQSGDIYFKTLYGSHQGLRLRYEVSMKVNDNNEIYIIPLTKYGMI